MKRWRFKRADRLRTAPKFIAGYTGKSLVRGYMRWFRVDRLCTILELTQIGVVVPESEVPRVRPGGTTAGCKPHIPRRPRKPTLEEMEPESDDRFAFIAGHTSGGAPYGTTWEEMENLSSGEPQDDDSFANVRGGDSRQEIWEAWETLDDARYAECVDEATMDAYGEHA